MQVEVIKFDVPISDLRCHLESPSNMVILDSCPETILLCGWILSDKALDLFIVVDGDDKRHLPYNVQRPGVIQFFNITDRAIKSYGFSYEVKCGKTCDVYLQNSEETFLIFSIKIHDLANQVLMGKNGYLFLSNDTNASVDQFTGQYHISDDIFPQWQQYFAILKDVGRSHNVEMTFLVIPAKEEIMPEYYPYKRGNNIFIDKYMDAFGEDVLYPRASLSECAEYAYYKVDTHLSSYGAYKIACAILERFGLEYYTSFLPNSFVVQRVYGDLGGKLTPPLAGLFLGAVDSLTPVFDNRILNTGCIRVYVNSRAPLQKKVLIFGDSFSTELLPFLNCVFYKVVYLYSAATLVQEIYQMEKFDYMVCQSNQRFIVVPPAPFKLQDVIVNKVRSWTINNRDVLFQYLCGITNSECTDYAKIMKQILMIYRKSGK